MHNRPARTAHDGRQLGIQVRLDPLGAFSLLGVPLHELGNRVVKLDELLGADAERWAGQLCDARGWQDRFAVLDALLAGRMATGPEPSAELAWAWRRMQSAGGAVRVSDLAVGAGCSHRHLVGLFPEQIGATPKTAARVLRYVRAARLLARGDLGPAQVAALCGYADQSHLTREYAVFAGTTPGAAATMEGTAEGTADPNPGRSTFFKTAAPRRAYPPGMTATAQRIVTVLVYADIEAAHDFLVETFGFSSGGVHRNGEGEVMHGEVSLDGEAIWLHRVSPDYHLRGVAELGSATGMLNVFVPDVDEHHTRSAAAGARIIFPPADQPYGQGEYGVSDLEGRLWSFAIRT